MSSMRYETFLLAIVMSEYGTQNDWPGSSNGSFRLASFLLLFPFEIVGAFWFVSLWRTGALAMELGSITSTAVGVEFRVPAASVPETHASDTGSFSLHHVKKRPLPDKIELRTLSLSLSLFQPPRLSAIASLKQNSRRRTDHLTSSKDYSCVRVRSHSNSCSTVTRYRYAYTTLHTSFV